MPDTSHSQMKNLDNRACRLLAGLFADLGGKRRKICIRNAYLVDSIDSVPSWQSGGREFDPRRLRQIDLSKENADNLDSGFFPVHQSMGL
jgi:hypothetical protein